MPLRLAPFLSLALVATLAACGRSEPSPPSAAAQSLLHAAGTTRYAFANACWAVRDSASGRYVALSGNQYAAAADSAATAEPFFLKPSALGKYLLYGHDRRLAAAQGTPVGPLDLASADDSAEWTVVAAGDATDYPEAPQRDVEPDAQQLAAYLTFKDPNVVAREFTLYSKSENLYLSTDAVGMLAMATEPARFSFTPLPPEACAPFPEAGDNVRGESFKGTLRDGRVLGFADSHLHGTSADFLGGAKTGFPFHKFGVTHALADCEPEHGPQGSRDVVGALFNGDTNGHATDGWPTFTDWPARGARTHEAVYWKWLERAWKAGLRVMLNYSVDNKTLCEIERNVAGTPARDCSEMKSARRQIGTAYALMDYVDGQYGGRGAGWYRVVSTPEDARAAIAQGKLAVLLGIEVSNLLDCSVTFNPANTQDAFEETGSTDVTADGQRYGCAMTETGAPNEILTQLQQLKALGVVGLFTVHEFDNAFGGSDIFDGTVLNLGTKENSGGIGTADQNLAMAGAQTPAQLTFFSHFEPNGEATGEFWSTYDCPAADSAEAGGGYVFPNGAVMPNLGPAAPACPAAGRGGRYGGKTYCYPASAQCNGRSLTPIGLYAWSKIMQLGFVFEIDHLGHMMKEQLLDLAAAQSPNYPVVSGHAWAGLSWQQARRIYAAGGIVYPSLNNTREFMSLAATLKQRWRDVGAPGAFAIGFGSDTNGMSPQMDPRASIEKGKEVTYPFTLFKGPGFDGLAEFRNVAPVIFDQPEARDPDGRGRTWSEDVDGNAHYGMAADFVQELRLEGTPEQIRDLYNSAEGYLEFWERTRAASAGIQKKGLAVPAGLLKPAPVSAD